jgi:hypothetical protein
VSALAIGAARRKAFTLPPEIVTQIRGADGVEEAFWSRVEKEARGCWVWTGNRFSSGYGRFYYAGVTIRAHRFAYLLTRGILRSGEFVCHHCDNRACVCPDHLYAGSHRDNMEDRRRRERAATGALNASARTAGRRRGELNGRAKLTAEQVRDIRHRYASGKESQGQLAREFGVRQGAIWAIVYRKIWTHV